MASIIKQSFAALAALTAFAGNAQASGPSHIRIDLVTTEGGWDFNLVAGAGTDRPATLGSLTGSLRRPQERETLTFGSTYGTSGFWGASGRFVGLQYKTDRSLSPGFITSPGLSFNGLTTAPGAAQIYINGRPSGAAELNAGPLGRLISLETIRENHAG